MVMYRGRGEMSHRVHELCMTPRERDIFRKTNYVILTILCVRDKSSLKVKSTFIIYIYRIV